MELDAVVNGTLHAPESNLQNIRGVNSLFAKDDTGIGFHTLDSSVAFEVEDTGNLIAHNNLNVLGNISCSGTISGNITAPSTYWAAGKVDGNDLSVPVRKGTSAFTVTRATDKPVGVWKVSFSTPHPDGADYVVQVTPQQFNCTAKVWEFTGSNPTANDFHVVVLNTSGALTNAIWHFSVVT